MRRALLLALVAALVPAGPAAAASQTIQAVDGTPADNFNNRFAPAAVTIRAGETVTWRFAGTTGAHNVASDGGNWTFRSGDPAPAAPDASFTFAAPGTYTFLCQFHSTTMKGTVTVTDASGTPPPPPPPPPLSAQPFPNDQPAPAVLEITDDTRPRLSRVRVRRIAHGARVRFRVTEPARVTIRARRGHRTVKARSVSLRRSATRTIALHGLAAGSYRIEVLARDLAGNRSRVKRARLTVRG